MKIHVNPLDVTIWVSAEDTERWATRAGNAWPSSTLRGHRFCASFDSNGLFAFTIDSDFRADIDGHEFNAITSDLLRDELPAEHPAWFVAVGQFEQATR